MQHTQTWTDIYGSACARFEGRAGGHPWLVAAPPQWAADVPDALETLDAKGTVQLLIYEGLTPLLAAAQEARPRGVLVVAEQTLGAGPALLVPPHTICAGGVTYAEGGEFPAWQSAQTTGGLTGANAAASAISSLKLPVTVSSPQGVLETLARWMDITPHGR